MWEDGIVLEHHTDITLVGFQIVDDLVIETDFAAVHTVESRDHAQQGGLAAAGRPQQCKEFTGLNFQLHPV